ncbi:non-ribosomal peptide synthetase [Pseudoalteromonas sp. MMG005]|uniref:non-ribosomal peptide synthetase n=1 Tax=Pseudoalteromonas sp. MMG005 TaxID=2822682 RepID=UPI001B3A28C3|nr:non-ribosomal peptide synthetase [Pseudoalteromonas sp. MMG005]MBQ4845033.1 amino acid adenylation domain-containing protein [Pseudoalteromonas sp. MMG005]
MNGQLLVIEDLIAEALSVGVTLYEKQGSLAFKQTNGFPEALKLRVIANKAQIIAYFQQRKSLEASSDNARIPVVSRSQRLPLTFAQQGLWFIEQLQGSRQYYMPAEFELQGKIEVPLLRESIKQIVERHEILRTRFSSKVEHNGQPHHLVSTSFDTPFEWINAAEFPVAQRHQKIIDSITEHQSQKFDLEKDILLRVLLISDGSQHYLAFNMHHIVSDGASLQILVQDLQRTYCNLLYPSSSSALSTLPIQYVDYAHWQKSMLSEQRLATHLTHWQTTLAGLDPIQSLPTDKPRPAIQQQQGLVYRQQLTMPLLSKIQAHAAQQSVTPFMWLLSSFMLFIGRINQSEQVVVGTPVRGREHPQLQNLIGLFVNTLVIRADLSKEQSFNDWLQQQKDHILQAFEYRDTPFDKVVEGLNCPRDLSHHPLVQILFTLEMDNRADFQLPELDIQEYRSAERAHQVAVKCDIELNATVNTQGLLLTWKFDKALYEIDTIMHWATCFEVLLEHIVEGPQRNFKCLELLNQQQQIDLAVQQSGVLAQWDKAASLVHIFEQKAAQFSHKIAIKHGENELTYQQLNDQANQLAWVLRAKGVRAQDMLPVSITRRAELVVTLLAVLKVGAAYVPIDPDYPVQRINYILDDVGSKWVLCDAASLELFNQDERNLVAINIDDAALYADIDQRHNLELAIESSDLAYMIYTSGTTGRPKGVQIEHRHVVRLLCVEPNQFDFNEHDVWTLFHSFCFDFSVWEMYGALLFGGQLVVVESQTSKNSPAFAQLLFDEKVTVLNQTPSAFYALQIPFIDEANSRREGSHLRYVIFGGEALQPVKLVPWATRFTNCQLINMYGITETTVHVTFKRLTQDDVTNGVSNIGRPIATTSCYVLDKQQQLLPMGAVGELYVGGAGVCRGYWQRPELNDSRFIADPFSSQASQKLYRTGDLVRYLPTGELTYIDRADDQVKVRGYRIELGEIENQLRMHPWLASVVVLLNKEQVDNPRISAFVVLNDDAEFNALTEQVQQFLRATLPDFMLPSNVIAMATLPLTSNGKIDKKALIAQDKFETSAEQYESPESSTEEAIASAFESILAVEKVGRNGHFFALGGHSLLATQLVAHLTIQAKLSIALRDLFQFPVVKDLAAVLVKRAKSEYVIDVSCLSIPLISRDKPLSLSFAQQRLWSIDKIRQGSLQYHMPSTFVLFGELNVTHFKQAWQAIIQRHEVLRTTFKETPDGLPIQVIHEQFELPLQVIDGCALNNEQQQRRWLKVIRDDQQQAFNLNTDLPLRLRLFKRQDDQYKLLVNLHHIAGDAHSLAILIEEIEQFYAAFTTGSPLPAKLQKPLAIQYADYAHWQRLQLQNLQLSAAKQFWLTHLQDAPPLHHIPLDKSRTTKAQLQGDSHIEMLSPSQVSRLMHSCAALDVTPFVWLHTVYSLLVAKYSGSDDVVIGSPFSGRSHSQLDPLIGFFINTLPIRTQLLAGMTFSDLVRYQQQVMLDVHEHQVMPFEQIIDGLKLARGLNHHSVFQLTFSLNPEVNTVLKLQGMRVAATQEQAPQIKFDIELACTQLSSGMRLNWGYNNALFELQTIVTMAGAFTELVEQLLNNSTQLIDDIQLHCTRTLNAESSGTVNGLHALRGKRDVDAYERSIVERIVDIASASCTAENTAIIEAESAQSLSYRHLHEQSELLAKDLINNGLQSEEPVIVSMLNGAEFVISLLAVLKAGGCYVPVDPNYPDSRIIYIINDCGAKRIITTKQFKARLGQNDTTANQVICIDEVLTHMSNVTKSNAASLARIKLPTILPDQLAYIIYTSGTTGQPKGVMIPHSGLANLCRWHNRTFDVGSNSIATQTANIAFDAATWEIWPYLSVGACSIAVARNALNDPQGLSKLLNDYDVSHSFLATPIAEVMLSDSRFKPAHLRYLLVGGDKLSALSTASYPFKLINNYGPTEASVVATSGEVQQSTMNSATIPDIGLPIDNFELLILNERQHRVLQGMIGELYITGDGLARGYLNRPKLTQEKFVNVFNSEGELVRAYRTGDLVRQRNNGRIAYIGRNDAQVKIRGYRIELAEIEHQLRSLPDIAESVVLAVQVHEGPKQLVAFVITAQGVSHTQNTQAFEQQALASLRAQLPEYMVPNKVLILSELPLTPHGKVDHKALISQLNAHDATIHETGHEGPAKTVFEQHANTNTHQHGNNSLSARLLEIYRQVLNNAQLQTSDDFFAAGGDSIISIQIASRARALQITVSVADIFNFNTVALLAAHLAHSNTLEVFVKEAPPFVGELPLLPIQRWFFEQQFTHSHHWNQALLISIDKVFEVQQIRAALASVMAHHDGLRLVVNHQQGAYQLSVIGEIDIVSVCSQFDAHKHGDNWQQAFAYTRDNNQSTFSFDGQPLFKVCHVITPDSESRNRLQIIAHHLLIDGVSWRVLLEDINHALIAVQHERPLQLPPRTANLHAISLFFEEQGHKTEDLAYWQALTEAANSAQLLSFSKQKPATDSELDRCKVSIPETVTRSLLTTANQPYNTGVQSLLLAALHWCAMRHYQTKDWVVLLEGHGRELLNNSLDSTRTVGWLTAMYPLRLFSNTNNLADVICNVKEQLAFTAGRASQFGALRYAHPDEAMRESLEIKTKNQVFFNYLGQLDTVFDTAGVIGDATESAGVLHAQQNHAYYGLQITAAVVNEQLSFTFEYDKTRITEQTVANLVAYYQQSLIDVASYCNEINQQLHSASLGTCGNDLIRHRYTPSDFSLLADVSNLHLQDIIAQFPSQHIADIYPMSALQQGMWFHSQYSDSAQQNHAYLEQSTMLLEGEFDVEAFVYAWEQVVAAHSILRTAFVSSPIGPVQVVISDCELPLHVEIPSLQSCNDEAYIEQSAADEYQQGIDLRAAPCLRLKVVLFESKRIGFIWTYHHLIMDGWSLPILFSQLLAQYTARVAGFTSPKVHDNYRDYIDYLEQKSSLDEQQFWHTYLYEADETTLLANNIALIQNPVELASERAVEKNSSVVEHSITLPVQLCSTMQVFSRQHGLTLNHLLQGAWAYWISMCCNKDYALFGQTVSGRPSDLANIEQRIGLYINTQPVLLNTQGDQTILHYLAAVKHSALALSDYAHSPLTQVQGWSAIDNAAMMFDALYVFENFPDDPLTDSEQAPFNVIRSAHKDETHYPMTLVIGQGEQLSLTLCYQVGLFNQGTAEHCLAMLSHLLNEFVQSPEQALKSIPLDGIEHSVAHSSSASALSIPTFSFDSAIKTLPSEQDIEKESRPVQDLPVTPMTIQQCFSEVATRFGDLIALEDCSKSRCSLAERVKNATHSGYTVTYKALDKAANQLANYLSTKLFDSTGNRNAQPIIAVCLPAGTDLIVAILAILKMGAAYLPIAPNLPAQRKTFMLLDAGVDMVLTQSAIDASELTCIAKTSVIALDAIGPLVSSQAHAHSLEEFAPQDICYVIYTSGTTGVPKGVMVEQQSVLNYVTFLQHSYGITSSDNYLQFASCSFDVFAEEVFCTLLSGATLVLAEQTQLLNTSALASLAQQSKLTLMSLPTAYWHQLAASNVSLNSQLRLITIGGEQMQLSALTQWQKQYGTQIKLINAYGPTETTISATLCEVTHFSGTHIPIGQPISGLNVHILDKYLRPVPSYVAGELYISGCALARGYLNDVQKTASVFIEEPNTGIRLYKTGDKVRCQNNQDIYFLGRLDSQVKVRGYRIELGEIERHLQRIESVTAAAVVVRQSQNAGEQLVAFIETCDDDISVAYLRQQLAEQLPEYMVPQLFQCVAALPHNNNGKIDRHQLVVMSGQLNTANTAKCVAPTNPIQALLVERFRALLSQAQVSIEDDFFTLGGHSLLAMRLVGELSYQLQVDVPVDMLFRHSTIVALAREIEQLQLSHKPKQLSTVLCLQKGEQGYTPVVLVAGAGGLLMAFSSLVQQLDDRIPIYGLQPDEIAEQPDVVGSLAHTAAHYLSALADADIHADVHFVGHSFGSFIIYEMAKQLQEVSQQPTSLLILDTPLPTRPIEPVSEHQATEFVFQNIDEFFQLGFSNADKTDYLSLDECPRTQWLSKRLASAGYHFTPLQLARFQGVFKAQLRAHVSIDTLLTETLISVIKATGTNEFENKAVPKDMGWYAVSHNLTAYEAAGDHLSILQQPNNTVLIEQIQSKYVLNQ